MHNTRAIRKIFTGMAVLLASVLLSLPAAAQMAVVDGNLANIVGNGQRQSQQQWQRLFQELQKEYDLLERSNNTLEEIKESNAKIQELTETIEQHIKEIKESMIGPMYEELVSAGSDGEEARNKLADIYRQDYSGLGLGLSASEAALQTFSDQYGFLSAETLFATGSGLYAQRQELTDSVYFAGYAVQETLDDMAKRYTRYDNIEEEIGSAEDQKGRETLANILALENGRAMMKMLEMQSIHINLTRQQLSQQIGADDSRFTIWGIKNQ
ncbi:hypothetical protein MNBD_ALPHA06-1734 [hydrothermal vent metagenome]|uniref:Uncharacterized protein n=1 Tax=hydrothermal vent metagenome TaxID=652676 RepID=A0A3B0SHU0_9ZZZZ